MKGRYLKITIVFILILGLQSCKKSADAPPSKKTPISVTVVQVTQNDIKEYLTFNGVTQYQKKEDIRSNLTGYISFMPFKIGDEIGLGQTFASLRTKEQDALKEAVKIDSSLKKFIGPIRISSNATGIITMLKVNKDDYVAEGDVLATVVQPKTLVVQVNVPYEYGNVVKVGSLCEILLQNGETINANITGTLPTIDPAAQSKVFLIALPNVSLPENLNVQVRTIFKEASSAKTIPQKALQTNELLTEYWVMKIVNDSMAIKVPVVTQLKNDSLVQISANGLQLNDLIISEGAYQMQDSTIVSFKKQ